MQYILKEHHLNVPDKALIADLRKVAKCTGKKSVTVSRYMELGKYHPKTLRERFGSWNNAIIKAGLKINVYTQATKEDLLENIGQLWRKLKRQPTIADLKRPLSKFSVTAYVRHFGAWSKALKAFIRYVNSGNNKDEEEKPKEIKPPRLKKKITRRKAISLSLRYAVLKRDHYTCQCGRSPAKDPSVVLHVDHKKPLSKDGTNDIKNLEIKCNYCNLGKGDKID